MKTADLTLYPDVNRMLAQLLTAVRAILQDQFVGMYVDGSLASGDFDYETSDIDFVMGAHDRQPGPVTGGWLPRLRHPDHVPHVVHAGKRGSGFQANGRTVGIGESGTKVGAVDPLGAGTAVGHGSGERARNAALYPIHV